MFHLKIVLIFLCFYCLNATEKTWPAKYPRCYRDDPNLNKCMVEAAQKMKPFLKQGLPEFNIAPISPFQVPEVNIQQGSGSAGFKIIIKNLTITGFDTYEFNRFDLDLRNRVFDSEVKMGPLSLSGKYSMSGNLLSIPLEGKGDFKAAFESSNGTMRQQFVLVNKRGVDYWRPQLPELKIKMGKVLENSYSGLFDDNELFGRAVKQTLRENRQEIIEEMKPAIEKVIGEIIVNIQNSSFAQIPFDKLYPLTPK